MSVALNMGTRTSAEQPEDLKGRYLVSLKLIERLHRLLLDVIKDEFERLGRSDVFPVTDLGVRKGFGLVFVRGKLPDPATMQRRGERWRPYRSVASWYLWRALEL